MRYRPFGKTNLSVSELGFGCARIGGVFQRAGRVETVALLRSALDAGITFFDTADMYSQGESERLVGDAFAGHRHQVVIATKFGYVLPAPKRLVQRIKPLLRPLVTRLRLRQSQLSARVRGGLAQQDFSPEYIRAAVEASLRRLKTDYIDVYQLHDPPLDLLNRGDFIEPLERLREEGKIRFWGVAGQQPEHALAALQAAHIDSVQVGLSALEQAALDEVIPRAAERGVAIIARQPFASGLLTRRIDTLRLEDIDYEPEVAARKRAQIQAFAAFAERSGRSRQEMALTFSLASPRISVIVLGVSRADQLEVALRALEAPPLSAAEYQRLISARRSGR
jgi:aryl-alcohol dehydrogenase-like predicted oxidoreductase